MGRYKRRTPRSIWNYWDAGPIIWFVTKSFFIRLLQFIYHFAFPFVGLSQVFPATRNTSGWLPAYIPLNKKTLEKKMNIDYPINHFTNGRRRTPVLDDVMSEILRDCVFANGLLADKHDFWISPWISSSQLSRSQNRGHPSYSKMDFSLTFSSCNFILSN